VSVKTRKKLIEVALPLEAINTASVREGYIYRGNPSALHKWWAQRPMAAARAVIFAQLVDDPAAWPDRFPTEEAQDAERQRLFRIIEQLVIWENTTNEDVLEQARSEIRRCWRGTCEENKDHPQAAELFDPDRLPGFHDPFCGGGALPLEGQRLGLEAWASDLNPVAVLITKAMIEIPTKFASRPPVGRMPSDEATQIPVGAWTGTTGLAEDVRRYGAWMRAEAEKRIGYLYPKVVVTKEMADDRSDLKPHIGRELTVIAWLWARTVKSPNPAFANVDVPLVASFALSTKRGKEAWVDPVIRGDGSGYDFVVRGGGSPRIKETMNRRGGTCLMSGTTMPFEYLRSEGKAGRMGHRLMAVVVKGDRGRFYLSPSREHETVATLAAPVDVPETELPERALGFRIQEYGIHQWRGLFTDRQLVALATLSDLVQEAREKVFGDALEAGLRDDGRGLDAGGTGATAYADAVSTLLAFGADKTAEYGCTIVPWYAKEDRPKGLFARQAIPMVWDYAEVNPLADIGGTFLRTDSRWRPRRMCPLRQTGQREAVGCRRPDAS
jgi:putative DNA methylase